MQCTGGPASDPRRAGSGAFETCHPALKLSGHGGEGPAERAGEMGGGFGRLRGDISGTAGDAQVIAKKRATAATRMVSAGAGDPVGNGLVASLARPGGNVTGLSLALTDTAGKRL